MAEKKEFRTGIYAIIAGVLVAVILVASCGLNFKAKYTGFHADKVARQYVDTIVQAGDGYNAYKQTLISKDMKYGDFVINAYMLPYVNDGEDVEQAEFVGTGSEKETKAIDEVYNYMYNVFTSCLQRYGFDDYDRFYKEYFQTLKIERKVVYNDDYMDTEFMFGAFEANVATYAASLKGTDEELAADEKTVVVEAQTGKYEEMYGEGYRLTTIVDTDNEVLLSDLEAKAYVEGYSERIQKTIEKNMSDMKKFKLDDEKTESMNNAYASLDHTDDISQVKLETVSVVLDDGKSVASIQVYVVRIGNTWYVDNTNINTSALYLAETK